MESATIPYLTRCVALLAEGVDRNREDTRYLTHYIVALLAEGVDRNQAVVQLVQALWVALLAEGVDRNRHCDRCFDGLRGRPPRGGRG